MLYLPHPMQHRHTKIYKSWTHIAVTFGFVLLPVLYLLLFSRVTHVATTALTSDVTISTARLVIAYIIALVFSWVCAVLFYRGPASTVALPIFDILQCFPTFAGLPLAVHFLGAGSVTVIVFLFITVVWPILFSLVSSLKLIKSEWHEAAAMAHLRGWEYFKKFLWPATIPGLVTGSVIGLGEGWEAMVATEIIVGTKSGVGNFFQMFSTNATMSALGIFGLLLLIFTINKLIWLPLLEWSSHLLQD